MKKKILILSGIILVLIIIWFGIRFILGGPEDDWICDSGQWVRHGNPSAPKPTGSCGPNSQIANPASVFCEEQGGKSGIKTPTDGGQFGLCQFSDGRECEEWDFFRTKVCGTPSPTPFKK